VDELFDAVEMPRSLADGHLQRGVGRRLPELTRTAFGDASLKTNCQRQAPVTAVHRTGGRPPFKSLSYQLTERVPRSAPLVGGRAEIGDKRSSMIAADGRIKAV
jgi:hypothetical protein